MRKLVALLVIGSGVLLAADLCASAPVKVTITGCVTGGVLISERTDFGTHTSEGKSRINTLAPCQEVVIKGDELKICIRHAQSPDGRPTDFSTKPDSKKK